MNSDSFSHSSALVIDDNNFNRSLVRSILMQLAFSRVEFAHDVRSTEEVLKRNRVDIVLLDWGIRTESGNNLLKYLCHGEGRIHSKAPILVISSELRTSEVLELMNKGASQIMIKPLSINKLMERVGICMMKKAG